MKELPDSVVAYRRTKAFSQESVPAALLNDHATGPGVWGVIHVDRGRLEYTIDDKETHILSPEKSGVVEPEVRHHVRPLGEVSFYVEFYR